MGMDVISDMYFWKKGNSKEFDSFRLLAIRSGDEHNWRMKDDDISLLKIGHVIDTAFTRNKMTVWKETDYMTAKLIRSEQRKEVLKGKIDIYVAKGGRFKSEHASRLSDNQDFMASYAFDFKVRQIRDNMLTSKKLRFDYAIIKIIDKTEKIDIAE